MKDSTLTTPKRRRWQSVIGWILITIAVLGQYERLTDLSTLPTRIVLLTLGTALILGWRAARTGITLAAEFVLFVVLTIGLQMRPSVRMAEREKTVIGDLAVIGKAQLQYYSQYKKYAPSLTQLGPTTGAPSTDAANLIDAALASGEKDGYRFLLRPVESKDIILYPEGGYTINADPITFGTDGSRAFFSDETMVIRENLGPQPATHENTPLERYFK